MRRYFENTRTHTYSLLFALPLLVLYELGAVMIAGRAGGMRNGADVLLRTLLSAGGLIAAATQVVLGGVVRMAADQGSITQLPILDGVVLSLGAGIYEELLFRVLLTGGLFALLLAMGVRRTTSGIIAVVVSAFIFSAFHYIGPYAYPLELNSFTFRFLAGLAFSALYMVRGFGVAAWTHALYDVFRVVAGQG